MLKLFETFSLDLRLEWDKMGQGKAFVTFSEVEVCVFWRVARSKAKSSCRSLCCRSHKAMTYDILRLTA